MVSTLHIAAARRLRARARLVAGLTAAFALWTMVVWGGRIRNVIQADDLSGPGRSWRLALAVGFVVGGAILVARLSAARGRIRVWSDAAGAQRVEVPGALLRSVGVLALATTGVWLVRGTTILLGDHEFGFKAVHTVLAVTSIALAVVAWSAIAPRSPGMGSRR
jgi:hypothetical protein